MIGLDTSVVLRLLLDDPPRLAAAVRRRVELARAEGEMIHVSEIVLAESYAALRHHYALPRPSALAYLRQFCNSGVVTLHPTTQSALLTDSSSGLADRLIQARHTIEGWKTLTCDRRQAKLHGAELIRT